MAGNFLLEAVRSNQILVPSAVPDMYMAHVHKLICDLAIEKCKTDSY